MNTNPQEIHADDKDVEVKISAENTGTVEVKNLKVTMEPQTTLKSSKSYTQQKDVGILRPSESSQALFYIDVDETTQPGQYELGFDLSYQVGTEYESKRITVPITVKESPRFELTSEKTEASIGESSQMRLKVTNKGSECDSVTIWVLKKSDHPFDFEDKSQYIGDLKQGQEGEALIKFTVEDDASQKEYILPIELRCTHDDKVHIESEQTIIKVDGKQDSQGGTIIVLAALAVVIAAVAWKRRGKTKKKE